jgi:hypothetical protein
MSFEKKWTIGIVSYKSSVYLEYQLKILYGLNDPKSFKLIIIDNSTPFEKEEISKVLESYKYYNNCEVIYFDASKEPFMRGSGQHGQGLNEILKRTDTKFLLVHDPDFFFVQDKYLDVLEQEIESGHLVVGAPYRFASEIGSIGNFDFPAAFGAAYLTSAIKGLDFSPSLSIKKFEEISKTPAWLDPNGADVGWKIRSALSILKYKSFSQKSRRRLKYIGKYSGSNLPYSYYLNNKLIAYHLFRGTFVDSELSYTKSKIDLQAPDFWNSSRKKYAKFFYYEAIGDKNFLFRIRNKITICWLWLLSKLSIHP